MLISAIVNYFVSEKLISIARNTDIIALDADGWHLRIDVLTSLGIFVELVAIKLTGITALDPLPAMLVAPLYLRRRSSLP